MKQLDFCPKIIVISKKKVLTSNQSRISSFLSPKTSHVEKKQEKKEFLIESVFDFWQNFSKEQSVNSGTKVTQPGTRDARRQF